MECTNSVGTRPSLQFGGSVPSSEQSVFECSCRRRRRAANSHTGNSDPGPFVKSWRPTYIAHNDFYDDQMLALPDGRIALVDFEEAGPGDPLLDVGNFLAHLRWGAHFGRERDAEAKDAYRAIFRQVALERFGWDERELALRQAVCLFRICTNAIRHPQPDWRRRLKDGLSLVNEVLDS